MRPIVVKETIVTARPPQRRGKVHAAEVEHERRIAQATGYTIRFYKAPSISFGERAKTLAEAVAIAQRLNAEHGKHGRRACIYATQPDGRASIPVPYEEGQQRKGKV
jgi:hypothetical protein